MISTPFPDSAGRAGVAEFNSTAPLIVVVFRFNSTGAFTALDAVPAGTNTSTITRTLAHAADGNNFETTVLLVNTDTNPASYTLRFDDELGNIPALGFQLQQGSLTGMIPPGQSVTIQTAGLGTQTQQGWAELTPRIGRWQRDLQPENRAAVDSGGDGDYHRDREPGLLCSLRQHQRRADVDGTDQPRDVKLGSHQCHAEIYRRPSRDGYAGSSPGRNHEAFEFINTFPNSSGRAGVAEFVSNVPLSAVDFRFNSSGAFTALGILPY